MAASRPANQDSLLSLEDKIEEQEIQRIIDEKTAVIAGYFQQDRIETDEVYHRRLAQHYTNGELSMTVNFLAGEPSIYQRISMEVNRHIISIHWQDLANAQRYLVDVLKNPQSVSSRPTPPQQQESGCVATTNSLLISNIAGFSWAGFINMISPMASYTDSSMWQGVIEAGYAYSSSEMIGKIQALTSISQSSFYPIVDFSVKLGVSIGIQQGMRTLFQTVCPDLLPETGNRAAIAVTALIEGPVNFAMQQGVKKLLSRFSLFTKPKLQAREPILADDGLDDIYEQPSIAGSLNSRV